METLDYLLAKRKWTGKDVGKAEIILWDNKSIPVFKGGQVDIKLTTDLINKKKKSLTDKGKQDYVIYVDLLSFLKQLRTYIQIYEQMGLNASSQIHRVLEQAEIIECMETYLSTLPLIMAEEVYNQREENYINEVIKNKDTINAWQCVLMALLYLTKSERIEPIKKKLQHEKITDAITSLNPAISAQNINNKWEALMLIITGIDPSAEDINFTTNIVSFMQKNYKEVLAFTVDDIARYFNIENIKELLNTPAKEWIELEIPFKDLINMNYYDIKSTLKDPALFIKESYHKDGVAILKKSKLRRDDKLNDKGVFAINIPKYIYNKGINSLLIAKDSKEEITDIDRIRNNIQDLEWCFYFLQGADIIIDLLCDVYDISGLVASYSSKDILKNSCDIIASRVDLIKRIAKDNAMNANNISKDTQDKINILDSTFKIDLTPKPSKEEINEAKRYILNKKASTLLVPLTDLLCYRR